MFGSAYFGSTEFGSERLLSLTITILPTGIASVEGFGTPSVTFGVLNISPTGIVSLETFGIPSVSVPIKLELVGIESVESFGNPRVTVFKGSFKPSSSLTSGVWIGYDESLNQTTFQSNSGESAGIWIPDNTVDVLGHQPASSDNAGTWVVNQP